MTKYNGYAVIYLFTSPSGKRYIGQSIDFKRRYNRYKNNKGSVGKAIKAAITKYNGIENFKLEILVKIERFEPVEVLKKTLDHLEKYYIKKYDTFGPNGYNLTAGGNGSFKREVTTETRAKISASNKGKNLGKNIVEPIKVICPECGSIFYVRPNEYRKRIKKAKRGKLYCSRACGSKKH